MEISRQFAMEMVKELGVVINQNINFIDRNGIIIASTDIKRIDSFHMGAKRIIDEGLPYLVIDSDDEYTGSKKGVNLPIIVDQQIQGIIGITGERSVVVKYGEIIKRFTEMYIRDNMMRKQQQQDEKIRSRFIENWLMNDSAPHDPYFSEGAKEVGLNPDAQYRIILVSFSQTSKQSMVDRQSSLDQATQFLRTSLCNAPGNHTLRIGSVLVFLIEYRMESELKPRLQRIAKMINQAYSIDVHIGFENNPATSMRLSEAYRRVQKALMASQATHVTTVSEYDELYLELLINDMNATTSREFVEKVFGKMGQEEREVAVQWLSVLYLNDGSIQRTADQLFIHKNTLQYKLRRIKEVTGMDPRSARYIPIFTLAIAFSRR